jgi:glutathione S-transferase
MILLIFDYTYNKRETTPMYTLYGRPGSGSLAVQVALEELTVPYQRVWIGQEAGEVERFRSTNPTGKVPALKLPDGTFMFESAAMLIHLAATSSNSVLAPQPGTSRHASFLQWMVFLSANVYEAVLRIYYSARYSTRGEGDAAAIRDQGVADFCTHLGLIGRRLAPYVLGADYSIADAYLYMLAAWYPGDKSELYSRIPTLQAHVERIAVRPAVVKAEQDHAA